MPVPMISARQGCRAPRRSLFVVRPTVKYTRTVRSVTVSAQASSDAHPEHKRTEAAFPIVRVVAIAALLVACPALLPLTGFGGGNGSGSFLKGYGGGGGGGFFEHLLPLAHAGAHRTYIVFCRYPPVCWHDPNVFNAFEFCYRTYPQQLRVFRFARVC